MTEGQWLTGGDPRRLVQFASGRVSERKLRLFACAACRRVWGLLDERGRAGVTARERYEDGRATADELQDAVRRARDAQRDARGTGLVDEWMRGELLGAGDAGRPEAGPAHAAAAAGYAAAGNYQSVFWYVTRAAACRSGRPWGEALAVEAAALCEALRDIGGNPFRPAAFDRRWRTADTVGIARGIHEDRAFDRLPLLADALMDAGCADEHMLGHCRSDGPHVRGCWVVDLVLDKE